MLSFARSTVGKRFRFTSVRCVEHGGDTWECLEGVSPVMPPGGGLEVAHGTTLRPQTGIAPTLRILVSTALTVGRSLSLARSNRRLKFELDFSSRPLRAELDGCVIVRQHTGAELVADRSSSPLSLSAEACSSARKLKGNQDSKHLQQLCRAHKTEKPPSRPCVGSGVTSYRLCTTADVGGWTAFVE